LPKKERTFEDVKAALEAAFLPKEDRKEYLGDFETRVLRDG